MPQAPEHDKSQGPKIREAWMAAANKKIEDAEIQKIKSVLDAKYKEDPRIEQFVNPYFQKINQNGNLNNNGESRLETYAKTHGKLAAWQMLHKQVEWFANQSEAYKQLFYPPKSGGMRKSRRKSTKRRKTRGRR